MKDYAAANKARGAVKILYNSQKHYETITGDFKMLREWKVRVLRLPPETVPVGYRLSSNGSVKLAAAARQWLL